MLQVVDLTQGDLHTQVRPDLGAGIALFNKADHALLRPTEKNASDPLALGCFPLVPYSNRIAHGRFHWADDSFQLGRNLGTHPHSIHGCAWLQPWRVTGSSRQHVTCEYVHTADAAHWPWSFATQQQVTLTADSLMVLLSVSNADTRPMPAGLGLHPFFPLDEHTQLDVLLDGEWSTDETCIPISYQAYEKPSNPWPQGRLKARSVDCAFTGWQSRARLSGQAHPYVLEISASANLVYLVIYVPPGESFCCVEPVSHLPNAHNANDPLDQGLISLPPGETLSATMTLRVLEP